MSMQEEVERAETAGKAAEGVSRRRFLQGASATAIAAMASMLRLGEGLSAREVYDLALSGNEKASRIFIVMGQALGVALATLVNAFNFPLYLLSGGVLAAWDLFAPPMLEEVRRRS